MSVHDTRPNTVRVSYRPARVRQPNFPEHVQDLFSMIVNGSKHMAFSE